VEICTTYICGKDALNTKTSSEEEEKKTKKNTLEEKSGGRLGTGKEIGNRIASSSHKTYLHVASICIAGGVLQYSLVLL
jgi:hypothetical protein